MSEKSSTFVWVVIISALLLGGAVVLYPGYRNLRTKRGELEKKRAELAQVQKERNALKDEADRLQNDPTTIEAAAKKNHNMIRSGETISTYRDSRLQKKRKK